MSFKTVTNIFLTIFAIGALFALFRYTNILDMGVSSTLDEGLQNLQRIISDKPPKSELSKSEKENLKDFLDGNQGFTSYFCGSTFFPFISGANWSYRIKSGNDTDIVKIGIPSGENGLIYLDSRLASKDKWTIRTIAKCEGNKIKLTDLNFLLIFLRDRTITTPCQAGQFNFSLPSDKDVIKGNAWLESSCLIHDVLDENYNEKQREIKENLEIQGRVLGQEKVIVPAGEFNAEKIEFKLTSKQETTESNTSISANLNIWLAEETGIVKVEYQEQGSTKAVVTQELLGFQIPTEKSYKSKND